MKGIYRAHERHHEVCNRIQIQQESLSQELKLKDLALTRVDIGRKDIEYNKLESSSELPYKINVNIINGTYKLETLIEEPITRTWNSSSTLVKYFLGLPNMNH